MDGPFYLDTRTPFIGADIGSTNLTTTDVAIYAVKDFPVLGSNYFGFPGKTLVIKLFGRYTTVATPGNLTVDVYWGTGANANGTIIQSSAATALTASQSNISWWMELTVRCTTTGSSGALFCTGIMLANQAVLANTVQPILIPASAAATSSSIDLTAANIISVQMKASGTATQTVTVHNLHVIALN